MVPGQSGVRGESGGESGGESSEERSGEESEGEVGGESSSRSGERLGRLMEEFVRRQRQRPDLVVRPWWRAESSAAADGAERSGLRGAAGFVVEYCPRGVESAELAVRPDRVRVEAPGGLEEVPLDLERGWYLDGDDRHCRETLVNHLLSLADRLLEEAA